MKELLAMVVNFMKKETIINRLQQKLEEYKSNPTGENKSSLITSCHTLIMKDILSATTLEQFISEMKNAEAGANIFNVNKN